MPSTLFRRRPLCALKVCSRQESRLISACPFTTQRKSEQIAVKSISILLKMEFRDAPKNDLAGSMNDPDSPYFKAAIAALPGADVATETKYLLIASGIMVRCICTFPRATLRSRMALTCTIQQLVERMPSHLLTKPFFHIASPFVRREQMRAKRANRALFERIMLPMKQSVRSKSYPSQLQATPTNQSPHLRECLSSRKVYNSLKQCPFLQLGLTLVLSLIWGIIIRPIAYKRDMALIMVSARSQSSHSFSPQGSKARRRRVCEAEASSWSLKVQQATVS